MRARNGPRCSAAYSDAGFLNPSVIATCIKLLSFLKSLSGSSIGVSRRNTPLVMPFRYQPGVIMTIFGAGAVMLGELISNRFGSTYTKTSV